MSPCRKTQHLFAWTGSKPCQPLPRGSDNREPDKGMPLRVTFQGALRRRAKANRAVREDGPWPALPRGRGRGRWLRFLFQTFNFDLRPARGLHSFPLNFQAPVSFSDVPPPDRGANWGISGRAQCLGIGLTSPPPPPPHVGSQPWN